MRVWASWRESLARALGAHRAALGRHAQLGRLLAEDQPSARDETGIRAAAEHLADAAMRLPTGWLTQDWAQLDGAQHDGAHALVSQPLPEPAVLRVGLVHAAAGLAVPLHVPLFGQGHLAIDAPIRDARVAGLFQNVLTRVCAAVRPGGVRVLAHDPAGLGRVFAPLRPLIEAGVIAEVGADRSGLLAAFDEADAQVHDAWQSPGAARPLLLLTLTGLPPGSGAEVEARLAALAHAGPAAGVALLLAEWPPARPGGYAPPPELEATVTLTERDGTFSPSVPGVGARLDLPVELDPAPPPAIVQAVCSRVAAAAVEAARLSFDDLVTDQPWTESSADGLVTPIGRDGRGAHLLRFDDATPHWLVGGRSGAGKTVFLLDVLSGLTVRYSPAELALFLLDFKEGISFSEFTPTDHDPSWIPHAVAVGIESDREYGVAVLRALREQMQVRAGEFKRAGVTGLAQLRRLRPQLTLPRVLAVIDEFQVLFTGNDETAREATGLLEEIARKGRSYGVHLVLASQTTAGIEALQTKIEAIFGQFPMRVALPGGSGVLDPLNPAADGLPVGTAVVNPSGGIPGANTLVRLPFADSDSLVRLRHRLWAARPAGNHPPSVFAGFAEQHVDDDPTYRALSADAERRQLLLGRLVDVGSPTATVPIDAVPGRHLAVIGPSETGADVLHAALVGLARQHRPGSARFLLAPLVPAGDQAAAAARAALTDAGHHVAAVHLPDLAATVADLAAFTDATPRRPTYLALFGAETAGPVLTVVSATTFRPALEDLRMLVQQGPVHGVHLLGWWRGLARLAADLGPSAREDLACVLALNVPGQELQTFLGQYDLRYAPRANRALLLDRHEGSARLVVPFVRPRRESEAA